MTASTMMDDYQLTLTNVLQRGSTIYGDRECITWKGESAEHVSYAQIGRDAAKLANVLSDLGVGPGDRVGTFCWNNAPHLAAYFAIPCMGAVLHTLNLRLFVEQLAYVIDHAEDKVILVDDSIVPLLARVAADRETVQKFIVVGEGDASALPADKVLRYSELVADAPDEYAWPELDEKSAAALCYTSGTTGNPKGVAYSHRSNWLHSMAATMPSHLGIREAERILAIVPMFHANAWGLPYAAFMAGADLLMPDKFLQPAPLAAFIAAEKATLSGAVPSIWSAILQYGAQTEIDLSSLERIICGGSAVPRSMIEALQEKYDVQMIQAWGMTETNPLGAVAHVPPGVDPNSPEGWDYRVRAGRLACGLEARVVDDDGEALPWDGESVGELQVRGPWVSGSYYETEAPEKFDGGWLRTGDVVNMDEKGFIRITDRSKDVIKSGGEWISSVDLENEIMGHPDVVEAAVVGVPDDRWDERPLACVVFSDGASADFATLRGYLAEKVAKWWLPERWTKIDEVPKTSVGKFDKKVLRKRYADGELEVTTLEE